MIRTIRPVACFAALGLSVMLGFTVLGEDSPADLIAKADLAYMTRYLEEDMSEAIALYEAVLPNLEELSASMQAYVLNRLSQLCYEAPLFSGGPSSETKAVYQKGQAYGFQSLRLNEEFATHESESFANALTYVTDAAAAHWTASNWGMVCELDPLQGLIDQGSILQLFRRAIDIDPTFWGASPSSSLGSLLIMLPGWLGGDDEAGLALIEQSVADAPTYLSNRIILAEYWGFTYDWLGGLNGVRDAELIEREVAAILGAEIGDWPFWNRQAKVDAERLLAQLRDRTD